MTQTRQRSETRPLPKAHDVRPRIMKGQEWLAETFRRSQVPGIFFVPTFLYSTLGELARDPVKRVLCHAEKAAGYMADGCAQASGRPGIVITQGGPGACNLAAGLAEPWMSHTPVLALTARTTGRYHGAWQAVNPYFGNVTKWDTDVPSLARLPDLLGEAYRQATTGAPAPVHLAIEFGAEWEEADFGEQMLDDRYFIQPAARPAADDAAVAEAVRWLQEAEQPLIVAGRGAITSGAWDAITALAERLNVPVATSLGGKGSIDGGHRLSVGVQGGYRRPVATQMVGEADLIVCIGNQVGGATPLKQTTPIISINIDPSQPATGQDYPHTLPLVGDARVVVEQMLAVVGAGEPAAHAQWVRHCETAVQAWWQAENERVASDAVPIRPERLAVDVVNALPADALVVADTGYNAAWSGAFMDLPAGKNYLCCEGSMGWAFPASLGAKVGAGDRPVVCWTGDGAFYCHLPELETAVRNQISTITVILNNHALVFDTHLLQGVWSQWDDVDALSEFTEMNFAKLATGMGANGIRVTDPRDIGPAIQAGLAFDGPTVIDVVTDHGAVAPVGMMATTAEGGWVNTPERIA